MTSKQEKLAAARRKLKEFQGKHKAEVSKQKSFNDPLAAKISKNYLYPSDSAIHSNHFISDVESSNNSLQSTLSCFEKTTEDNVKGRKTSESSSDGSNFLNFRSEIYSENENIGEEKSVKVQGGERVDCANGLRTECIETHNDVVKKNFDINVSKHNSTIISERNNGNDENNFSSIGTMKVKSVEGKEFSDNGNNSKNFLNDIRQLQMELENHAQTITILIQQRNDAQTALSDTQQLLNKKLGEAEELKLQISCLTSSIHDLSKKLFDAEDVILKLKLEKEDNLQAQNKLTLLADNLKVQLNTKEEELQEIKNKYEEKSSNCEQLLFALKEAQGQLSVNQIQLQQYSAEGLSSLATQVSELQNENHSLRQKISKLEKQLEMEISEKEESSQKFHIYAQQCNSQLSSLNSQLKTLKLDNESLSQKNETLSNSLSELESAREKTKNSPQSYENEIADLHNQLSALFEKNNQLQNSLQQKKEECTSFENQLCEKDSELSILQQTFKKLEEENKELVKEIETPKANERLLATMESDKIAAAKAVSQNQKLKEQIIELEKAFMKLSEEKLELTNQLAHEKHINSEFQNLLKNSESKHCDDNHHHHHHHHHHHNECREGDGKPEPLVNDSNEIGELRNIVRQLQDDKMELKARLSSYESNKISSDKEIEDVKRKKCDHDHDHEHEHEHEHEQECELEEAKCESTKLLLQQMEEKVRKTMNEIAILDEEKEKLEHLVLQLQGETETIGEYITLYQKQRMLLRQRAQEKDIQLLQLAKDKEELKSKLSALDELVQRLIFEKENIDTQQGSKLLATNSSVNVHENTAGKIRALINEIGTTTLINNHSIAFEHCSCCSGRLITI